LYVKQDVEFTGQFFGKFATAISNIGLIGFSSIDSDGIQFSGGTYTFTSEEISVSANAIAFVSAQIRLSCTERIVNNQSYDVSAKIEMYDSDDDTTKSISYIDSDSRYMRDLSVSPFVILTNTEDQDVTNKQVIIKLTIIRNKLAEKSGDSWSDIDSTSPTYQLFISPLSGVSYKAMVP
jgi:hypothetical protein